MHAYDIMLIVSIACVIGFVAVIYVENDLVLALGYVVAAVIGTFSGAYLAFWFVPIHDQFAVIFGAFGGGLILAILTRVARSKWPPS